MVDLAPARTLGVVICTHAEIRRSLLHDLVRSIAGGDRTPDEIVIVVDRNPALLDRIHRDAWPVAVSCIAGAGSGLASARNTGWRSLSSDLIAFIDDDAVASRGWLAELGNAFDELDADIVGGRIDADWVAGEPAWYSHRLGWIVGCSYEGQPTVPTVVRNVIGCNMLMRRSLLEALDGFETSLGRVSGGLAGCEETELCIRATARGARVVLTPTATVAQVLPAERGSALYAVRRAWHEGRSKRLLTELHGSVLGTEASYARGLLTEAARRIGVGVAHRKLAEIQRAGALVAVLAAAGTGYAVQAAAGWLKALRPNSRTTADARAR